MITAILTNSPSCYTARQLADVGRLRGHEMVVVDDRFCFGKAFDDESESTSVVDSVAGFDAVFAWLDSRNLSCGLAVMRECESNGTFSPNTSDAVKRTCDRLWLAQTLAHAGFPTPHTVIAHSTQDLTALLDSVGEGPWVLKLLAGSHSFDRVVVVETREAAMIALGHFRELDRDFLIQRYIVETNRTDIRVLVVGGRAITAVLRQAKETAVLPAWRFSAVPGELKVQERHLAENVANTLELEIADVTLLRSNHGPLVLDVNPFPPLQCWDQHVSESVAYQLFDLIELRAAGH